MEDVWYEEELLPEAPLLRGDDTSLHDHDAQPIRVMIGQVRWKALGEAPLQSSEPGHLYLIRLRFQFMTQQATILHAKCSTHLWATPESSPQPVVYDMYPKHIFEGKPRTVQVQLGPEFRMAGAEAKIGSASSDITVGRIFPKITGYPGEKESKPYWEIYPSRGETNLEGLLDFWLIVETPLPSRQFAVAVLAEATAQGKRRFLARPKKNAWDARPRILIGQQI